MQISKLLSMTHCQRLDPPTLKSLADLTLAHNWSPFIYNDNYRKGDNWEGSDVLALDVDDGCTLEEAKQHFSEYQYILTTSKSHQIEKNGKICDRFRLIIPFQSRITDKDIYRNTWYTVANKYTFIDQQCKDFGRFFYSGKDIVEVKTEGKKLEPILEEVESKEVSVYKTKMPLNKGKLSRQTMEFMTWGGEDGHWINGLFKAAKDFQEQGYEKEEFIERAEKITGHLDGQDLKTIDSAYSKEPKYAPRGVNNKAPLIAKSAEELLDSGIMDVESVKINGPKMFDATEWRWRKGESLGLVAGSGTGKCHGKDTPILMYDGTIKPVQDVKVGDQVMGPDSKPRLVLGTTSGTGKLYRVTPTKGDPYVVNEDHVLSLKYNNSEVHYKGIKKGDIINISVKEWLKKPKSWKTRFKGYRSGVDFKVKDLKIDPYNLGIWLGDGSSSKLEITTMDEEVVQNWKMEAVNNNLKVRINSKANYNKAKTYNITTLTSKGGWNRNIVFNRYRNYNLFNNKHIPHDYLTSSREQRLQLLAGLIDSDGHLSCNGYEITQKNDKLANDILYLARSLGFAAYNNKCKKSSQNKTKGVYNRIFISGDLSVVPVKLERKKAKPRRQVKDHLSHGISIEELEVDQYYGFEVDSDHLYLLGDFTVTHNSAVSMKLLKEIIQNNPDNDDIHFFFTLEMSARQVLSRWKKLVGYRKNMVNKLYVIDNEQTDERIGWQHIVRYVEDTCAALGKTPGCIIIDHFKALSNKIDTKMQPNFDVSFDMHSGLGTIKNISINEMCRLINAVAKRLDAFVIVQNQSTKGRAGDGDLPMGIDAAHGAADFEWFCDYIITVWQPLKKVQDITNLTTTAWQYCKIRETGEADKVFVYTPYVLKFEKGTGDLRKLTEVELDEFRKCIEVANERRKDSKKQGYDNYHEAYEDEINVIEFKRDMQ